MMTIRMTLSVMLLSPLVLSACGELDTANDQNADQMSAIELSEEAAALEREVMSHHVGDDEDLGEESEVDDEDQGEWSEDLTPREFCAERAHEAQESRDSEVEREESDEERIEEEALSTEETDMGSERPNRAERACLRRARRAVRRRVSACLDFCMEEIDVDESEDPRADFRACYEEECPDFPPPRRPSGERPQDERPQGERPQGERPRGERPQGERPQGEEDQS